MTKISQYALDSTISEKDKVLGTDFAGSGTKNFSVESLRDYFLEFVDGATTLSKTVTITPAQLLALDTQLFVEILPAPEEGKAYLIDKAYFYLDFNTTPYDITNSATFYYYDLEIGVDSASNTGLNTLDNTIINANIDITYVIGGNALDFRLHGKGVYLRFVGNVSQGDSNIKVKIDYKIVDLAL